MTVANPLPETPVSALTQASIDGSGVFDVLMRATKAHLEQEFSKNRIKGPEFATVYLGALQSTMQTALAFLAQSKKMELEAQLLEQQILLADRENQKAQAQLLQIQAQTLQIEKQTLAVDSQILQTTAQTALVQQQKTNLVDELLTATEQRKKIVQDVVNLAAQKLQLDAQTSQATQQTANLVTQKAQVEAQTLLINQQTSNALTENTTQIKQQCKLSAEFDVLMETKVKTATETSLLAQKVATEKAQITALGVDDNSVIGKQKLLYGAQTTGYQRDAEQKAAKLLVDTWTVRRTTDEGTVADATNMLNDSAVGRAVTKLLSGVNA